MPLAVDLSGVAFGYDGANRVLSDVDLKIDEGEFVAIAGPNGGGKTTLVRLVLGLERPDCRRGAPLRRAGASLLAACGARLSRAALAGSGSTRRSPCARSCRPGRLAAAACWDRCAARDRAIVSQAIADVGLEAQADAQLAKLSGGQQQRAFVAKALAGEPSLLVLDEPTTGVDADAQEAFGALLSATSTRARRVTDALRLARVRRGRVGSRAGSCSFAAASSSTDTRASFPTCGTTLRTCMLEFEFMRIAFAAGIVVGLLAPAVGFFLVQRRMSLVGDGLGHAAFAGVAAGYLLGISPVATALVASVGGAVGDRVASVTSAYRRRPGARASLLHGARGRCRADLRSRDAWTRVSSRSCSARSLPSRTETWRSSRGSGSSVSRSSPSCTARSPASSSMRREPVSPASRSRRLNVIVAALVGVTVAALDADRRDPAHRGSHGAAGDRGQSRRPEHARGVPVSRWGSASRRRSPV